MKRLLALGSVLFVSVFAAVPAFAAVAPHDHWLTTGNGSEVHVGPKVCDNPDLYHPFLLFHENVHQGVPGTTAFDKDSNPVSIRATPCDDGEL